MPLLTKVAEKHRQEDQSVKSTNDYHTHVHPEVEHLWRGGEGRERGGKRRGGEEKEGRREEGEGKGRGRKRGTAYSTTPHTVAQAATPAAYQRDVGMLHDSTQATLSIASTLTATLRHPLYC